MALHGQPVDYPRSCMRNCRAGGPAEELTCHGGCYSPMDCHCLLIKRFNLLPLPHEVRSGAPGPAGPRVRVSSFGK